MFRYSFRARDKMKVSGSSTRFGQMKGVSRGFQLKGNPLFSITANNNGINARFNNEDYDRVEGMDEYLSWEDSTGEWVNVEIKTTFGKSMEVSVYRLGNLASVYGSAFYPYTYLLLREQPDMRRINHTAAQGSDKGSGMCDYVRRG